MPISIWVAAIVVIASMILARNTPLGRRIYAVGSSPSAARLAGLSPQPDQALRFTLTGFLVGVATIVSVPQLSTIESGIGAGFELVVVTAVVVGGTSSAAGRGRSSARCSASSCSAWCATVLIFLKLGQEATYWERAIQGGFILVAVLVDHLAAARTRRGGARMTQTTDATGLPSRRARKCSRAASRTGTRSCSRRCWSD